jgi:DNA polymerase-3 subunit epsilon
MMYRFHHLKHSRDLVVLDTETTGRDPQTDRLVEVAAVKFRPGQKPVRFHSLVRPGVPIPAAATEIHGVTDEDVAEAPAFCQIAARLNRFLHRADLAGFNIKGFDLPFLLAEYRRCDMALDLSGRAVLDAMQVYHEHEPRNLEAALVYYCGRPHTHAHAALGDVNAAAEVLDAQVARYPDLPRTVEGLHERLNPLDLFGKFRLERGRVVFAFGKHSGRPLDEVAVTDPDYLDWMLSQDFPDDAKALVAEALRQCHAVD